MTTTQDTQTECLVGRRIAAADELVGLDPDTVLMNTVSGSTPSLRFGIGSTVTGTPFAAQS